MANTLKIKRGVEASLPTTGMSTGEPLFTTDTSKLYIATNGTTKSWVGAPILDEDAMGSNSASKLATQQSIKAYVDAQDANIASDTLTLTNKTFDANGTGNSISNIELDDLKSGVLDTDLSSVATTDTTVASAKAIKTYIDGQVTAQDLDFTTDTSGNSSVDLDSQTLVIAGGEGMDVTHSGQTITVTGEDATATNKGIASFAAADFSITAGAVSIGSLTNSQLDNSTITVSDGTTSTATALGGTIEFAGTTDEVTVDEAAGIITIGLPDDVTISGDLTVNGEMTTTSSSEVAIGDVNIKLAQTNDSADSVDFGFYGMYASSGVKYAGLFRDQSNSGYWTLAEGMTTEPGTTATFTSAMLATLRCGAIDSAIVDGGAF
jgi:hypothetical protein